MSLSSSDFVTNDNENLPELSAESEVEQEEVQGNIKGVQTAGWVLAFLLPFVGVFLNIWLLRNRKKATINTPATITALVISTALSLTLMLVLFNLLFVWAV